MEEIVVKSSKDRKIYISSKFMNGVRCDLLIEERTAKSWRIYIYIYTKRICFVFSCSYSKITSECGVVKMGLDWLQLIVLNT